MAKNRIAGTAFVKFDGTQLSVAGSITVSPQANTKEGMAGLSGVAGYKETPRVPFIEVEAFTTASFDLGALEGKSDMTVVAELANGHVYSPRNAWLADESDIDGGEGTITIKFEGLECIKTGAAA
jgi:hypothetical protein